MPTRTEAKKLQDAHPDAWIPAEAGDTLEGTVKDVKRAWSDQRNDGSAGDGWYPLLKIETAPGVVKDFHAFTTVSFNEVMEKQPIPGERIIVTFRGEAAKSKPGRNAARIFDISLPNRDPKEAAHDVYAMMGGRRPSPPATAQAGEPDNGDDDLTF